jgi:single-stranded-DNA-specific exonuclease
MSRCVDRVIAAIDANEKIGIWGDYDVDGTTGAALLARFFTTAGVDVRTYIHDRSEGYGLNAEGITQLANEGVKVLITVDNGTGAAEPIAHAARLGIDTIVTDHHEPLSELQGHYAMLNPKAVGEPYPFAGLSGAGVAYKLAWALAIKLSGTPKVMPKFRDYLIEAAGLAALGAVADLVPLNDENRPLVAHGLIALSQSARPGMRALLEVSGLAGDTIEAHHLGFRIGPRINAVGRMSSAGTGLRLLLSDDPEEAKRLAKILDEQNDERREVQKKIEEEALAAVEDNGWADDPCIVLADPSWHGGVIGIVASRVAETFHKPALLIAQNDETGESRGSGRTIKGIDLFEAMAAVSDVFEKFGGHKAAAGFSIKNANIPVLRERLSQWMRDNLGPENYAKRLTVDMVTKLDVIDLVSAREMALMEPHGMGNPSPVFVARNVRVAGQPKVLGAAGKVLKFFVRDASVETAISAIDFSGGPNMDELMAIREDFDLAFKVKQNTFRGVTEVQLNVVGWRAATS